VGQLLLLSRTGKPAPAAADSAASRQLQALLSGNAAVSILAADTSAASDSAAAVAVIREQLGGLLMGVVHAAGVLEDGALRNQTHADLQK
jgi:NAD(P)-dependent dehydrogenase (short-subunit alcohol dehydrogenase family)